MAPFVAIIWLFGGIAYIQYALWGRVVVFSVHLRIAAALLAMSWLALGATTVHLRRTPGTVHLMVPLVALLGYAILNLIIVAFRFGYDAT